MVGETGDHAVPQGPDGGTLDGLASGPIDDAEHPVERHPLGLGLGPAGEGLGDGVEEGDAAAGVGGDDGIADAGEGHPTLFGLEVQWPDPD